MGVNMSFSGIENAWDGWAVEHRKTFTINSLPPDPERMSAAEMRKYGIEKIPADKIKERAAELGISPAMAKELLELGEPLYVAKEGVMIKEHPIRVFRTDLASFKDVSPGIQRVLREISMRAENEQ